MALGSEVYIEFQNLVNAHGRLIRFRYFNETVNAGSYDDVVALTQSGNDVYTSGMVFDIDNSKNSNDYMLVEQGRLLAKDKKAYILGDILTNFGASGLFKFSLGSPPTENYSIIPDFNKHYEIEGFTAYKKIYLRYLTTGSLYGE